jgi:hypothetical protein
MKADNKSAICGRPEIQYVSYDQIILLRNFFFRAFLIGLIIAVLYCVATYAGWNTWVSWAARVFRIDEKDFARLTLTFLLNIRILLVFFFLVPALALHWTAKKLN